MFALMYDVELTGISIGSGFDTKGPSHMYKRSLFSFGALFSLALVPAVEAGAQVSSPFIEAAIPFSYTRGRNTGVNDRLRPDYSALGIVAGGFTVFPSLTVGVGVTDNVYQADDGKKSAAMFTVDPVLAVRSDWSLHSLRFDAGGHFVRYAGASARSEDGWNVGTEGKFDVGSDASLNFGLRTMKQYESRFSGASPSNALSANPFQTSLARLLAEVKMVRLKGTVAVDFTRFNFMSIETTEGGRSNQDYRDRDVKRATGNVEYGITPDTGVFVQLGYTDTSYDESLSTAINNRSSKELQALGGVSFDLTSAIRGTLGVGYADRRYESPVFQDIRGLSVAGRIEYFPTELTTVTVSGRREIEDATFINSSGYFNTGGTIRVDHELLRNLILNVAGDYEVDDYRGIKARAKIFRASTGAKYLISPLLQIGAGLTYAKRTSNDELNGLRLAEARGLVSVTVHR
jgi:hypothetical protein